GDDWAIRAGALHVREPHANRRTLAWRQRRLQGVRRNRRIFLPIGTAMSVPRHGGRELRGVGAAGRGSDYVTTYFGCNAEGYREPSSEVVPPVWIAATSWGTFRSAPGATPTLRDVCHSFAISR